MALRICQVISFRAVLSLNNQVHTYLVSRYSPKCRVVVQISLIGKPIVPAHQEDFFLRSGMDAISFSSLSSVSSGFVIAWDHPLQEYGYVFLINLLVDFFPYMVVNLIFRHREKVSAERFFFHPGLTGFPRSQWTPTEPGFPIPLCGSRIFCRSEELFLIPEKKLFKCLLNFPVDRLDQYLILLWGHSNGLKKAARIDRTPNKK